MEGNGITDKQNEDVNTFQPCLKELKIEKLSHYFLHFPGSRMSDTSDQGVYEKQIHLKLEVHRLFAQLNYTYAICSRNSRIACDSWKESEIWMDKFLNIWWISIENTSMLKTQFKEHCRICKNLYLMYGGIKIDQIRCFLQGVLS